MAASDSQLAAGRRLAADVRAIRRKHGVDLKKVIDATRLAADVIEQLEENALVDHPAFNRVYLRSLFGAYGEAIGIQKSDMVTAIEEVFDGHYVGALARDYLGIAVEEEVGEDVGDDVRPVDDGPESSEKPDAATEDASEDSAGGDIDEEGDVLPVTNESAPDSGELAESVDASSSDDVEAPAAADAEGEGDDKAGDNEAEKARQTVYPFQRDRQSVGSVWSGLAGRKTVLLPNMSGTILVVIAGIAFVSLLWFSISTIMDLRSGDGEDGVVMDSTAVEEVFRQDPVILPDSLEVEIIAFTERLDPIRITADRDFRKPFWVERLDTHRVVITERILLEREADHTRVLVDGFLLPQGWLGTGDPVEITRDRVQTWLDSLVTEGIAPQREAPPEVIVPASE